jgi:aminoglycoside phosphotransferase (APT) family kinase protein
MTQDAAEAMSVTGAPSLERLADVVRRGLQLDVATPVELTEITEFSNINYVYRVEIPGRSLYLKVVPERAKRFPARLPRERVFSEAEGLRRFRTLAEGAILIPEVLFVDSEVMALMMSDVGEGREVLFSVIQERFELLTEQADALGRALGAIHSGTRGTGTLRPAHEEALLRRVVFEGLLAPGARQVFPELWDEVSAEMQAHNQCLIHADLWSKNLLVRAGDPLAVVDFEGVCYGDPAFDLATLIAVALLPAMERPILLPEALAFISGFLQSWTTACGSQSWADEAQPRAFRATATFLASRGFGPFAYTLSEAARERIARLAHSLASEPPTDLDAFRSRVVNHTYSVTRPTGASTVTGNTTKTE